MNDENPTDIREGLSPVPRLFPYEQSAPPRRGRRRPADTGTPGRTRHCGELLVALGGGDALAMMARGGCSSARPVCGLVTVTKTSGAKGEPCSPLPTAQAITLLRGHPELSRPLRRPEQAPLHCSLACAPLSRRRTRLSSPARGTTAPGHRLPAWRHRPHHATQAPDASRTGTPRAGDRLLSALATALRMVNTSLPIPLPVTSPPRSIMCRLTACSFSFASAAKASERRAEHAVVLRGDDDVAGL
jgi:hypothetical protein